MKREPATRKSRAAFTLVELIVVIGLMGLLATISIAGYNAASNGMKNRAVIQDTISLLRQAMQTALIDNTVTAVLFYNRLADATDGKPSGFAIAIRQAGRLTASPQSYGGLLIDEFADWHNSYPTAPDSTTSSDPGMRFYRMQDWNQLEGGLDRCSTLVHSYVTATTKCDDYMIATKFNIKDWAKNHNLDADDNAGRTSSTAEYGNYYLWGFSPISGDSLGWKAGDAYGTEFASLQLPEGFIFGSSAPSSEGLKPASVAAVVFDPAEAKSGGIIGLSKSVPLTKVSTTKKSLIGTVTENLLKDK